MNPPKRIGRRLHYRRRERRSRTEQPRRRTVEARAKGIEVTTNAEYSIYLDRTARRVCPECGQPTYSPYWEQCLGDDCDYSDHADAYELAAADPVDPFEANGEGVILTQRAIKCSGCDGTGDEFPRLIVNDPPPCERCGGSGSVVCLSPSAKTDNES